MIIIGIIVLAVLAIIGIILAATTYTVVEPNKSHVVVTGGKKRKVYHPSLAGSKSSYFYIPMLTKRIIVSLENVKHEIKHIELRDKELAPFGCDVTCWFKISNPEKAAEKLDVSRDGNIMNSIRETLNAQIQGVARAAAMKQEILDLMRDRTTFGTSVFKEVNGDLDEWGIQLVQLEIIDFSDLEGTSVIRDYEKRREAEIDSLTRQNVALREQEAKVKEAEAKKISEEARIKSEEQIKMRDIERMQVVGVREQEAKLTVAQQSEKANTKQDEDDKAKVLGEARYNAEAKVITSEGDAKSVAKKAEGEKQAKVTLAQGESESVRLNAVANAEAIQKQGTAEAEVVEKKAEAQRKFTDASKEIELAKIAADIQKTQYTSMAEALQNAKIQIISPDMNFMGLSAKNGAALGSMIESIKETSGIDLKEVVEKLGGNKKNK